jgi:hypothetical protein
MKFGHENVLRKYKFNLIITFCVPNTPCELMYQILRTTFTVACVVVKLVSATSTNVTMSEIARSCKKQCL